MASGREPGGGAIVLPDVFTVSAAFVSANRFPRQELTGITVPVARIAGIALIALGIACWPGPPLAGMLIYGAAVALYLAYLGFAGALTGVLLWPAVVLHAILTTLLTWAFTISGKGTL